ncbi:hypothetical protein PFI31113_03748 [Pandoraea fibrosis]|uniref:Uncharacterized protein n=1 Tax=Pandoraea fibrosis TaxID=1891094 RepID=A0A5E4XC04_9BURK|nr:hypothetical protein PFI31113_03748 [Pandoraea fibrosis]
MLVTTAPSGAVFYSRRRRQHGPSMTKSPGNPRICDIDATEHPYFGTFAMHSSGKRRKLGACEFSDLSARLAFWLAT